MELSQDFMVDFDISGFEIVKFVSNIYDIDRTVLPYSSLFVQPSLTFGQITCYSVPYR
jgi:hypothetical protein